MAHDDPRMIGTIEEIRERLFVPFVQQPIESSERGALALPRGACSTVLFQRLQRISNQFADSHAADFSSGGGVPSAQSDRHVQDAQAAE